MLPSDPLAGTEDSESERGRPVNSKNTSMTTKILEPEIKGSPTTPVNQSDSGSLNFENTYCAPLPMPKAGDPILALGPDNPSETIAIMKWLETVEPNSAQKEVWPKMRPLRTLIPIEHEFLWDTWSRESRDPEKVQQIWQAIFGPNIPVMTPYELRAVIKNAHDRLIHDWYGDPPIPSMTDIFDQIRGRYWRRGRSGQWNSYNKDQYYKRLFRLGRRAEKGPGGAPSEIDSDIEAVTERQATITEGMSGFQAGVHEIDGRLFLARFGYKMIQPDATILPLKTMVWMQQLLGHDGMHRVLDWLHHAVTALLEGRRGQSRILAIAGPPNCGKSFLIREIIRLLLGGRAADAAPWLLGTTDFASELGGAELLYVDDALGDGRLTTRLGVASMQKQIVTAGSKPQPMHAKGKDRYYHPVWWRHAVALNDSPEALSMLPPLDEGYCDKLILLRANDTVLSAGGDGATEYIAAILAELPGLMAYVLSHGCTGPSDGRGPLAWHDPELSGRLREAAPEYSLAGMILEALERGDTFGAIKMPMINPTLRELDGALRGACGDRYSKLCLTDRVTRKYLGRLAQEGAIASRMLDGRARWCLDKLPAWMESHHTSPET